MMIASLIGRPERSARTIRSIASGNRLIKAATRRLPIFPMTMCGMATPSPRPTSRLGNTGTPAPMAMPAAMVPARMIVKTMYRPMLIERPVRSSRATSNSRRGIQRRATWSILLMFPRIDNERTSLSPLAAPRFCPLTASTRRARRRRPPGPSTAAATSRNPAAVARPTASAATVSGSNKAGIMAQITSSSARSRPKYSARGRKAGRMPLDANEPRSLPSAPSP